MRPTTADWVRGEMWAQKFRGTLTEFLAGTPLCFNFADPPPPAPALSNPPGGWTLGMGGLGTYGWKYDAAILAASVWSGATFVDTAEGYGFGKTETALAYRHPSLKVATKVSRTHMRPGPVRAACDRSRGRLRMETLDLYQIHWPHPEVPIEETMGAMADLQMAGKIHAIGVCNFSTRQLYAAQKALPHGVHIVSNQIRYNLLDRGAENYLIPYCQDSNVQVLAYSPLGQDGRALLATPVLVDLSETLGLPPAVLALNWIRSKGVIPLPRTNHFAHAEENQTVFPLSQDDVAYIEETFPIKES